MTGFLMAALVCVGWSVSAVAAGQNTSLLADVVSTHFYRVLFLVDLNALLPCARSLALVQSAISGAGVTITLLHRLSLRHR